MRFQMFPLILLALPVTAQATHDHVQFPLVSSLGDFNERAAQTPDGISDSAKEGYGWGYGLAWYRSHARGGHLSPFHGLIWTASSTEDDDPVPGGPRLEYGHFQMSYVGGVSIFPGGGAALRRGFYVLGAVEAGLEIFTVRHGEWGDVRRRTTRFRPGAQVGFGYGWSASNDIPWSLELVYHPSFTPSGRSAADLPRSTFAALNIGFALPRFRNRRSR